MIIKVDRDCPVCGCERKRTITSGREREFKDTPQDLFFVVQCLHCDLVYLNPIPHRVELDKIYPKNYYCYNATDNSPFKQFLVDRIGFPARIRKLMESFGFPKVLDIGCGNGDALDTFKGLGADTTGLDFNRQALRLVSDKGHKTIEGRIEDTDLPEKEYDIIYSSNVIEHIADPKGMVKKVYEALKPNGIFLCETPNFNSFDARLFALSGKWGGFHFPRHWTFFTDKTFTQLAKSQGFKVISITYHPVPIFWIWTFQLPASFMNKVIFTLVDMIILRITGKTSLMSVCLRKE